MKLSNLLKIRTRKDFNHEVYAQILNFKNYHFLQAGISWSDDAGWPFVMVTAGSGRLFSVILMVGKLGIDFDLLSPSWYDNEDE